MEPILALVALAVLLSPILAIAALVQARGVVRVEEGLERLQRRIDGALDRIEALERGDGASDAPSAAGPEPDASEPGEGATPAPPERPGASAPAAPAVVEPGFESESEPEPREPEAPAWPEGSAPPIARPRRTPAAQQAAAEPGIDWERWIGVRGAAVVGGALLALAGLLLVRHMIDQGLLGPGARVSSTASFGALLVAAFPWLVRRGYRVQAACSGGAGVVMLYGAAWASDQLYGFIGTPLAFAAMSATTAVALWLSSPYRTRTLMVFAALGGFATPLVLGTWRESPVGLHAYALLLDGALLWVARRREWRWVQYAAIGGTVLLHLVWAPLAATAGTVHVGLVALLVLGVGAAAARDEVARITGAAGVIGLAFLYGLKADLGVELWQLGIVWVPAMALTAWSSRERVEVVLGVSAAATGLALAWIAQRGYTPGHAWQMVGTLGLAGAALVAVLRAGGSAHAPEDEPLVPELGVLAIALGLAVGVFASSLHASAAVGVVLASATGLTSIALVVAVAGVSDLVFALPVAGVAAGLVATRVTDPWDAVPALTAAGAVLLWARRTDDASRRVAALAAVAALLPPLFALPLPIAAEGVAAHLWAAPVGALVVAAVGAAVAIGARAPVTHGVTVAAVAVSAWTWDPFALPAARGADDVGLALGGVLALRVAAASVLALAPLAVPGRRAAPWHAAALAPALLFVPGTTSAWSVVWGHGHAAWLPAALAAVAAAGAWIARLRGFGAYATARSGAVAVTLGAVALAQRVDLFWPLMAGALGGAAGTVLARRLGHRRLAGAFLGAWSIGAVMLLGPAAGFAPIGSSEWILSPRLAWLYLLPAATAWPMIARSRGWLTPEARSAIAVLAALHVFAWINLTVFDGFGDTEIIVADWARSQAQNLTQSAAWIAFALALLGAGAVARVSELRWLSLAFLSLALLKVGLWDLRALDGLHRVASTAGMSIALLAVSLSYQRFVFGRDRSEAT